MTGISYYIREHSMYTTSDGHTRRCQYCNSCAGIGFYFFMRCELRFNEPGFRKFLEFRNLSKLPDGTLPDGTYIRRYTSDVFSELEIVGSFKDLCDPEETSRIVNMPEHFSENET